MIGRKDIVFRLERGDRRMGSALKFSALKIARKIWGEAIIEDAETGETLDWPLQPFQKIPDELLIYQNQAAKESWTHQGATQENVSTMIHVIFAGEEVTCVVDDEEHFYVANFLTAIKTFIDPIYVPGIAA